jgi:uncharacterized protein YndB with AHSA1/START domain
MSDPAIADPNLDLVFERVVPVPPSLVWRAWTTPSLILKWFTPAPWTTVACDLDLRPGGRFLAVMRSPEGEEFPMLGCYLEVVPEERLVWTNALAPGFRPADPAAAADQGPTLTAILTFQPQGGGTLYRAVAMHRSAQDRAAHEAMGFHEGWGMALDQLVEAVKGMAARG